MRFSKVYREFTRKKYNKYKLQYPKLRESVIIDKILKQWEALDDDQKIQLEEEFKMISGDNVFDKYSSNSKESSQKASRKRERHQTVKQDRIRSSSPKVRIFVDRRKVEKCDDDFQSERSVVRPNSQDHSESSLSVQPLKITTSKNQPQKIMTGDKTKKKKKKISKQTEELKKSNDYLTFFKYYYERLMCEHPRWDSAQISTICNLLWKKRNLKKPKETRRSVLKFKTGRSLYLHEKKYEGFDAAATWKALPFESKKYWEIKAGRGRGQGKKKKPNSQNLKFMNKGNEVSGPLSFMHKK